MAYQVLPSKLVRERITMNFEFMDELRWGEAIFSVESEVTVFSGVDNTPILLLYRSPVAVGTHVTQQIHNGLPGVIYQVACTVVGTQGTEAKKISKLAILPTNAKNPPYLATFLTTPPYPVDQVDSYIVAEELTDSNMLGISSDDSYTPLGKLIEGILYGGAVFYTETPDSYIPNNILIDVDLSGGAVSTELQYDSYTGNAILIAGTLANGLVQHTQPPDSYISDATLLSGTLT